MSTLHKSPYRSLPFIYTHTLSSSPLAFPAASFPTVKRLLSGNCKDDMNAVSKAVVVRYVQCRKLKMSETPTSTLWGARTLVVLPAGRARGFRNPLRPHPRGRWTPWNPPFSLLAPVSFVAGFKRNSLVIETTEQSDAPPPLAATMLPVTPSQSSRLSLLSAAATAVAAACLSALILITAARRTIVSSGNNGRRRRVPR